MWEDKAGDPFIGGYSPSWMLQISNNLHLQIEMRVKYYEGSREILGT